MFRIQLKTWMRFLLIFLVLALGTRCYFFLTDDFRLSNITYDIPYHVEWDIEPLTVKDQSELDAVLSQTFSYLGKGAQSYAFVSADQQYVLKFFKYKHVKPSMFKGVLSYIPPLAVYREEELSRKKKRFYSVFSGYHLAYERHRKESGLLFVQLNPDQQQRLVKVIDKIGMHHTIDVGQLAFIVQKKGESFRTVLAQALDKGDLKAAKDSINQIVDFYLCEYSKGIYDRDHGIMHNTGFINGQPLHLDVGKLTQDERLKQPKTYQQDLLRVSPKLLTWLNINYPQYAPELIKSIEQKFSKVFGEPFAFKSSVMPARRMDKPALANE